MYISRLIALLPLAVGICISAQTSPAPVPAEIKDPQALLAAVAPRYDFSNPALKPWHLKATYQLYDETGKPTEQGTWEYWWASPNVYRSTWTRGAITHSEWHTADGRHLESGTGGDLHVLERELPQELMRPLRQLLESDATANRLERTTFDLQKFKLPCVRASAQTTSNLVSTFCFDPRVPVLILKTSNEIMASYGDLVQIQGRALPRSLAEAVDGRRILTANLEMVAPLNATDAAFNVPPNARAHTPTDVADDDAITAAHKISGSIPRYPWEALQAHLTGTVLLEAKIGTDGKIHDLQVISSPGASLSKSSMDAVSAWKYQPALVSGQPVEFRTIIPVSYSLQP